MTRQGMGSEAAEKTQRSQGVVVTYSPHEHGYRDRHERVTRTEIGKKLAALKGYDFAGEYDHSACYAGLVYFVPGDTLLAHEATDLGIRSEHDLFGGVVPALWQPKPSPTRSSARTLALPRGGRMRSVAVCRMQSCLGSPSSRPRMHDTRRHACLSAALRAPNRSMRARAATRP